MKHVSIFISNLRINSAVYVKGIDNMWYKNLSLLLSNCYEVVVRYHRLEWTIPVIILSKLSYYNDDRFTVCKIFNTKTPQRHVWYFMIEYGMSSWLEHRGRMSEHFHGAGT